MKRVKVNLSVVFEDLWTRGLFMRSKRTLTSIIVILIVALVGCTTSIKARTLVPAKAHEAAKLRRVAVLPFDGRMGYQASADIEASLANI